MGGRLWGIRRREREGIMEGSNGYDAVNGGSRHTDTHLKFLKISIVRWRSTEGEVGLGLLWGFCQPIPLPAWAGWGGGIFSDHNTQGRRPVTAEEQRLPRRPRSNLMKATKAIGEATQSRPCQPTSGTKYKPRETQGERHRNWSPPVLVLFGSTPTGGLEG
jgi:hypothetical protein